MATFLSLLYCHPGPRSSSLTGERTAAEDRGVAVEAVGVQEAAAVEAAVAGP